MLEWLYVFARLIRWCHLVNNFLLQDTGLGVRKRVIKLLKGMYTIIDQQAYRVDTCCRLVGMVADQDEGVKVSNSGTSGSDRQY